MSFGCADKPEGLFSYVPRDLKEICFLSSFPMSEMSMAWIWTLIIMSPSFKKFAFT